MYMTSTRFINLETTRIGMVNCGILVDVLMVGWLATLLYEHFQQLFIHTVEMPF